MPKSPPTAKITGRSPIRYVTDAPENARSNPDSTSSERFELRRLCPCATCGMNGWIPDPDPIGWRGVRPLARKRCPDCRGEGRTLQLVATAPTPEAVGVALVTLAAEGEFEECPFGLLDTEGEVGLKWLVRPWPASPRTVSDAGKLLRSTQTKGEK